MATSPEQKWDRYEQHRAEIEGIDTNWTVVCSCGYISRSIFHYRDAEEDMSEHVRLMTTAERRI